MDNGLNPLHWKRAHQIAWMANHAEDQFLAFDLSFLPIIEAIAPHCKTVKGFIAMTDAAIEKEISDTSRAIREATGRPPAWFWSPFLEHDDRVDAAVRNESGAAAGS